MVVEAVLKVLGRDVRAKPVVVAANKVDLIEAGPVGRSRQKSDTAAMLRYCSLVCVTTAASTDMAGQPAGDAHISSAVRNTTTTSLPWPGRAGSACRRWW